MDIMGIDMLRYCGLWAEEKYCSGERNFKSLLVKGDGSYGKTSYA
ncbi:hypothetical protein FM120_30220 [Sphingobacterium faecium PCAi_F2.5]|nr:hypothetical protein FM120_30220 [Sphingobacterium faecium PCAi_F2.5]